MLGSSGNTFLSQTRATIQFDANIDYETLTDSSNNGVVRTKCPKIGNYAKKCNNNIWLWSHSGIPLAFTDWNGGSQEPNGETEHCMAMWAQEDYRFDS